MDVDGTMEVGIIIPICWQSKRTEESVYVDLTPSHLNCHLVKRHNTQKMLMTENYSRTPQTHIQRLTPVRRSNCDSLCRELVIKVSRVCLRHDLGLERWNELWKPDNN